MFTTVGFQLALGLGKAGRLLHFHLKHGEWIRAIKKERLCEDLQIIRELLSYPGNYSMGGRATKILSYLYPL